MREFSLHLNTTTVLGGLAMTPSKRFRDFNLYTPIPKIVVPVESNEQEADDRKGHWRFLLIHLFIRRYFDNMHLQMGE